MIRAPSVPLPALHLGSITVKPKQPTPMRLEGLSSWSAAGANGAGSGWGGEKLATLADKLFDISQVGTLGKVRPCFAGDRPNQPQFHWMLSTHSIEVRKAPVA